MSRTIHGFDYRKQVEIAISRREARELIEKYAKAGGRRRVEDGETYLHAPGSRIDIELYARLPAARGVG